MSNKFLLAMHYNKRRYITSIKSNFEKIQKMGQFWTEAKMNKMYWIIISGDYGCIDFSGFLFVTFSLYILILHA